MKDDARSMKFRVSFIKNATLSTSNPFLKFSMMSSGLKLGAYTMCWWRKLGMFSHLMLPAHLTKVSAESKSSTVGAINLRWKWQLSPSLTKVILADRAVGSFLVTFTRISDSPNVIKSIFPVFLSNLLMMMLAMDSDNTDCFALAMKIIDKQKMIQRPYLKCALTDSQSIKELKIRPSEENLTTNCACRVSYILDEIFNRHFMEQAFVHNSIFWTCGLLSGNL